MTGHAVASPAFDATNPTSFFTNVAGRLISSELNLNLGQLQVYPTNQYTPAVQRLLQVTANIFDATTTNPWPTVFRPVFSTDATGTQVFITSYQQVASVSGSGDPQLASPVVSPAWLSGQAPLDNVATNVYGIPWILGVKKGLPGFNQLYLLNSLHISRSLSLTKPAFGAPLSTFSTNQMYVFGITNFFGFSLWNPYTSNYTSSNLKIHVTDVFYETITNDDPGFNGSAYQPQLVFSTNCDFVLNNYVWPGTTWIGLPPNVAINGSAPTPFLTLLNVALPLMANSVYYTDGGPLGTPGFYQNVGWQLSGQTPQLPHMGLLMTNRLQAFLLDQFQDGNCHVLDYVQLAGPETNLDINAALADPDSTGIPAYMFSTNTVPGPSSQAVPFGVVNQINVSRGLTTSVNMGNWVAPSGIPQSVIQLLGIGKAMQVFFNAFFNVNPAQYGAYRVGSTTYYNSNLLAAVPFTPVRSIYQYVSWQANDPLVHYLASDLNYPQVSSTGIHVDSPLPTMRLTAVPSRWSPWATSYTFPSGGYPAASYLSQIKDPLVYRPDDWDFPTGQRWNLNWLGRVHRGTPWQTIYLKSSNILTNTSNGPYAWMFWTGDNDPQDAQASSPVADWQLVSTLDAMLNTNDLRTALSINNTDSNAWAMALDGFTVLTNITDSPVVGVVPSYGGLAVSSNTPQASAIATAILSAQTGQSFHSIGDVLAVPQLSEQSPYLNWNDSAQQMAGINDEAYEALPSQLLPLLRTDSIGTLSATNGQMQLQFSGYDNHLYVIQASPDMVNWSSLCTNSPINGTISFTVLAPGNGSSRQFYRSLLLQ